MDTPSAAVEQAKPTKVRHFLVFWMAFVEDTLCGLRQFSGIGRLGFVGMPSLAQVLAVLKAHPPEGVSAVMAEKLVLTGLAEVSERDVTTFFADTSAAVKDESK